MSAPTQLPCTKAPIRLLCLAFCILFNIGCDTATNAAVSSVVDVKAAVDPSQVSEEFQKTFQVQVPASHKGGLSLDVSVLGRGLSFHSLIPQGAEASEIFEGGQSIKYNPGPHTILVGTVTKGRNIDEKLNRALVRSLNTDADLTKVFIEVGSKKIAAYEKTVTSFGQDNLTYQIVLDGGKNLVITGPKATFDHEFKAQIAGALTKAHPANERLYTHAAPPPFNPDAACGLGELPSGFEVQLVHVKRGAKELTDQALDPEEVEAYLQPVAVGATSKPIVLVLMAGEPTVWQLSRTTNSQLAGVIATGRHQQRVVGLAASVPLIETASRSTNSCKAFYLDQRQIEEGNYPEQIWETFAQDPQTVHLNQKPSGFEIGQLDSSLMSDKSLALSDVLLDPTKQLLPGKLGIKQLVKNGSLRRGSVSDFDQWLEASDISDDDKKMERERKRIKTETQRDSFYAIEKSTELPLGMGGSNSMRFVAAAGIDEIPGDISHNTIFYADGRCKGPACPR